MRRRLGDSYHTRPAQARAIVQAAAPSFVDGDCAPQLCQAPTIKGSASQGTKQAAVRTVAGGKLRLWISSRAVALPGVLRRARARARASLHHLGVASESNFSDHDARNSIVTTPSRDLRLVRTRQSATSHDGRAKSQPRPGGRRGGCGVERKVAFAIAPGKNSALASGATESRRVSEYKLRPDYR